jgi:rSAM/selenodomain-associated transferase 1
MDVLGIFVKRPLPGTVKTRLAQATSAAWAGDVAAALLGDVLDRTEGIAARRTIVYAPATAHDWFASLARGRFELEPQTEGDLGNRLLHFFTAHHQRGADAIVAIGTDSPTLPLAFIDQAFAQLQSADAVLGPTCDGGYYLIGCGRRLPPVFEGIPWSTSAVLDATVRRLDDPSWRLTLLPPWYDIDTLDDWHMLRGHIRAMRRAGMDPQVPRLEALMKHY